MKPPRPNPKEWDHVANSARTILWKLPKTGNFKPHYEIGSWGGVDDIYRVAKLDAVESREIVQRLTDDQKANQAWPRGRYKEKFWLRARFTQAADYADALAKEDVGVDDTEIRAEECRQALRWLLYDGWDSGGLVHFWLAENLGEYTHFDSDKMDLDHYADYRKWLDRLEAGEYVPTNGA
jgi:hypothetical protein